MRRPEEDRAGHPPVSGFVDLLSAVHAAIIEQVLAVRREAAAGS